MEENVVKLGIGFATGRKSFRKVLNSYVYNWNETKEKFPQSQNVQLSLFVAYDLDYSDTQSTDFTNLNQDMVDTFEDSVFIGTKNTLKTVVKLMKTGQFEEKELHTVFGAGYAGKRNAVVYAALEHHMDYLLFLDDDEYPVAVTNNGDTCLWSGQSVLGMHLANIENADMTNGYHCGYISPIPNVSFGDILSEQDFRTFIGAISNDIINWENISRLMKSGGVTYADKKVLVNKCTESVQELHGCKFISGSNLCLNLMKPERTFPFYNPPGARGEDTFLSTLLNQREVKRIPCFTFHDGFSAYRHLLDGVLPINLAAISGNSVSIKNRFLSACVGWVRYKPLLTYITDPKDYASVMAQMRSTLQLTLPKISEYFHDDNFMSVLTEFDRYSKNVKKHNEEFLCAQNVWKRLIMAIE